MFIYFGLITFAWMKLVWMSEWFLNVTVWLFMISGPLGFILLLFLLPLSAYLFVLACTAILICLDYALVSTAQSRQAEQQDSIEAHHLLPQQQLQAVTGDNEADASSPHASPTMDIQDIQDIAMNTPLPPSRAATGFHIPAQWWKRLDALSDRLIYTVSVLTFGHGKRLAAERRRAQSISFSLGNLFFTALWYCFKYDPTGTEKPAWAEMLG